MLIVKNLKKTYKTKGGVEVHALDDVSITFPENGMVFLLGKSGSGKSTLLNVIGGLDRVDSGEIIVKGKNSKTFSGADYDSYRNTFIGFIFQEYNILNEFNVEQNISLALQLQGKPNDKEAVEAILEQVDLKGLGKRKPNTLSGGQKQRVAIARALIKNPEIIMADEPTGALDSKTGKQVFDTLKNLSKDKLVIVVSHDRDFAEHYGDRIIELSDGKVISDTSKEFVEPKKANENIHIVNENVLSIKDVSKLTEKDMKVLLETLKKSNGEAFITTGEKDLPLIKQVIHVNNDNSSEVFNDTKEVEVKKYDPKDTKFIRSRLPFARAFKMGASSLKLKPVRLIFTSFLTMVALTMFGLTSALMLFKESYSYAKALQKSAHSSEIIRKRQNYKYVGYSVNLNNGNKSDSYSYEGDEDAYINDEDIKQLNGNNLNLSFAGIMTFSNEKNRSNFDISLPSETPNYYSSGNEITGFSDAGKDYLTNNGLNLIVGNYPVNEDEICISKYHYESICLADATIKQYSDIINKIYRINIQGNNGGSAKKYKVVGVFDSLDIPSEFEELKNIDAAYTREYEKLLNNYRDYLNNSYQKIVFVSDKFYDLNKHIFYINKVPYVDVPRIGIKQVRFGTDRYYVEDYNYPDEWNSIVTDFVMDYVSLSFYDLNGNEMDYVPLKENEAYVAKYEYENIKREQQRNYLEQADYVLNNLSYNAAAYNKYQEKNDEYRQATYRLIDYLNNSKAYDGSEYTYEDDLAKVTPLINDYYVDIFKKSYTYSKARALIDGFNTETSEPWDEKYAEFHEFEQKVYDDLSGDIYPLTNYVYIQNYLENDNRNLIKHFDIIDCLQNKSYGKFVPDDIRQEINDLTNRYYSGEASSIDWDKYENYVKLYCVLNEYETVGYDKDLVINVMPKMKQVFAGYKRYNGELTQLEVKGYVDNIDMMVSHQLVKKVAHIEDDSIYVSSRESSYVIDVHAKYSYAISKSTFSTSQIDFMSKNYGSYKYTLTDEVTNNIAFIVTMVSMLKTIFLITGIVFAVFAALMLFNFIVTSIAAKTKEIGILRAVGARGSDLFKIFFSESGIITSICSILALINSVIGCLYLNAYINREIGITILNFGPLNIGMIIVGAILIAFLGTFVPVIIAAKKPPVESIRTL